jgi:hypothetical protein
MSMKSRSTFQAQPLDLLINQTDNICLRPGIIIELIIAFYLIVGFIVVNQYGESIDVPARMAYAESSLRAYSGLNSNLQDEKGPFYSMLALEGARILGNLIPGWKTIDGWNYMSFLSFAMGVFFFYRLCQRLFYPIPAIAATLLFSTQPIIWGHAFINPKDIPFMAFFLASLSLGLDMVDYWQSQRESTGQPITLRGELTTLHQRIPEEWRSAPKKLRNKLKILLALLPVLLISYALAHWLIVWIVTRVYSAPEASLLGQILQRFAENSRNVPVEAYISKAETFYGWLALIIGIGLVVCIIWLLLKIVPSLISRSFQSRVLVAGCMLGFASDIRTLGPAAGLLVVIYFIYKGGRKVITYVLEYLAVSGIVIYLFWPYLWKNPIVNYLSSLTQASEFPYTGDILFAGTIYKSWSLPKIYLPTLLGIQLTETALILIIIGLVVAGIFLITKPTLRADLVLVGVWFLAPIGAAILLDSNLYNNFRQFLFVLPALFIFAGLALQLIWIRLKGNLVFFIPFVCLILLPGLYWNWQLHPYQYVYYNSLAGGEVKASLNYDMDYWNTTYKDGAEFLNQIAPENSAVYFWNNPITAFPYIRSGLKIITDQDLDSLADQRQIYAVIATQYLKSKDIFSQSKVIYEIKRGGAVLAVVKQVNLDDYLQNNR